MSPHKIALTDGPSLEIHPHYYILWCGGGVGVRTTAQLKNTVVVRSAHHTKIHCGLDPYFYALWKCLL